MGQAGCENCDSERVESSVRRRRLFSLLLSTTILSVASTVVVSPAFAQRSTPGVSASQPVNFSIPAQPLSTAINTFIRATGWQISYSSQLARGKTSSAVVGAMTSAQALQRLVAGTGISVRIGGAGSAALVDSANTATATVEGAIPLDTIDVQGGDQSATGPGVGYIATRSATGTKSDTPIIETPQSISVVTRKQLDDQQPQNLNEALRYSPGVVPEAKGVSGLLANGLSLRGFTPEIYLDGLNANTNDQFNGTVFDPYLFNRVEVIGGPASVLYGQASPGGLINITSKRPTDAPIHEIIVGTGSYGRYQGAFDLGGPIDKDGQFLYRLTGVGFSQGSQVDFTNTQQIAIAPALTWRPDGDTRLTILGKYVNDPSIGAYGYLPARGSVLPNANGTIPVNFFSGDPNVNALNRNATAIGYEFDHGFNETWSVSQNFRYQHAQTNMFEVYPSALGADLRTLSRYAYLNETSSDSVLIDTRASAQFATWGMQHKVTFGVDYQKYMNDQTYGTNTGISSIDIFAPRYYIPVPPIATRNLVHTTLDQIGAYAQDQISLGQWRFLLGARYDSATNETATTTGTPPTVADSDFDSHKPTWRAGLVYLFDNGIAPYVSYSTSFQPQTGTTFNGTPFQPTTGQQAEAGVKYQPAGSDSFVTASVYDLTKQNVTTPDPVNTGFSVQTGEIHARGFELQGHANLTRGLELIASYTYMNARNTESNTTGKTIDGITQSTQGKWPVQVPSQMASLWANYTIQGGALAGFGFGGGVRYIGSSYGDVVNSITVPAFTVVDAAVHYDLGRAFTALKGLSLQVNATNLFDKTYVASCTSATGCYYGLRRTIYATLKYDW